MTSLPHSYRLRLVVGWLILAMPFFLIFVHTDQAGRACLYLASLLVFWLLAREQQARAVVTHPAVFTGLALIAFANLSVLWGHGPEAMEYLRWAPGMMTFWLAIVLACQVPDRPLLWLANGLLLIAAASTVYALAHYLMAGNLQERNYGPNLLFSPILGPSIIVALAATGQMLRQHLRRPNIKIVVALILGIGVYVLSTRSRGPLLGLCVWTLVLFMADDRHRRRNLSILGGLLVLALLFCAVFPDYVTQLIARGSTYRLAIWQHTLPILPEHLWFGRGMNFQFHLAPVQDVIEPITGYIVQHPHNLAMATVLYSGLCGLGLMALTTLTGLYGTWRRDPLATAYALPMLAAILALTLTDTNRLVGTPSPLWFVFWMPSAFLAGLALRVSSSHFRHPPTSSTARRASHPLGK